MKKRIIILVLAVALVIGAVAGGIAYAAPGGNTMAGQRLFGIGSDGPFCKPPACYRTLLDIAVANPDWQYSKTLERIVITSTGGAPYYNEIVLSGDEALLEPHEIYNTDFARLAIPGGSHRNYTVDVYWTGRGEALAGWIEQVVFQVEEEEPGEWVVLGVVTDHRIEMVNLR